MALKLANDTATTEQQWQSEHPASPGFEAVFAIAAILSVFGLNARPKGEEGLNPSPILIVTKALNKQ